MTIPKYNPLLLVAFVLAYRGVLSRHRVGKRELLLVAMAELTGSRER